MVDHSKILRGKEVDDMVKVNGSFLKDFLNNRHELDNLFCIQSAEALESCSI